jgi:hypothetical protein
MNWKNLFKKVKYWLINYKLINRIRKMNKNQRDCLFLDQGKFSLKNKILNKNKLMMLFKDNRNINEILKIKMMKDLKKWEDKDQIIIVNNLN